MRLSWNRRDFLKVSAAAVSNGIAGHEFSQRMFAAEPSAETDSWTSFRNSPDNLGIAKTSLPEELKLLWALETSDGTASTAVISSGQVFIGTLSGDVHCIGLKTGEIKWTYKSVEMVEPNSFAPGFNAPAAIDTEHVYIGDDQGMFHAIDRITGKRAWTFETGAEIVGGAQVVEDRVIFGSHDGHLYSLEAKTGKPVWKVETRGPVNATPCLAGKYTFTTGCDQPILRIVDIEKGEQAAEVPLNSLLIASPAMRDDILYFGTGDGIVYAMDWKNKKILWEFSVPEREQQMQSSPAVTEEVVILGSRDKRVYCLDRKTGKLRWEFTTRSKVDSSPVIVGDRVYFGSADRNIYGLQVADGKQVWKHPTKQSITGSAAVAEGCLVIGTDSVNGQILCFGGM
ncbi:PQQ-binding-like beta-propeller repeat protein [Planctomicrobium sp. SH661]|uniref:outer membrane protein assembly factor BamB family protein n=1 Tax=Planctomicrobium sp. SH661 TaxID=3448124 RepID=UPI003F5C8514